MEFSGAAPSGPSSDKPSESQIMGQLQGELQLAAIQEFMTTVRDKCFQACVTKPSSSLSSSEQTCLSRCSDRYGEATQIVTKAVLDSGGL